MENELLNELKACPSCKSLRIGEFFRRTSLTSISAIFDTLLFKALDTVPRVLRYDNCKDCGLLFLNPQWSEKALGRMYGPDNIYRKISLEGLRLTTSLTQADEIDLLRHIDPSIDDEHAVHRQHFARSQWVRAQMGELFENQRTTVADVGAGFGAAQKALERVGFKYLGFDSSQEMSKMSKKFHRDVNAVSFANLPQEFETKVDIIYTSQFMEHVNKPVQCLEFLRECLKAGGLVFVDVPSYEFLPFNLSNFRAGNLGQNSMNWGHMCHFNHVSLDNTFRLAGFKTKGYTYCDGDLWMLAEMVAKPLATPPPLKRPNILRQRFNISVISPVAGAYVGFKSIAKRLLQIAGLRKKM